MGYNESMTALADAVRAKSGATGKLTVDQMTEAVNGITSGSGGESGGGTDTSDATVTADKLLKGVIAYGAKGRVTGEIETVTPTLTDNVFTVPSGFIAEPKTLTVPESGELSVSENIVTVPSGYSKIGRKATVSEASAPTTSGNVVTVNKGYQSAQKNITVGTSKSAETFTPGTSDITIPADTYLSGEQIIKGDANLIAENIKSGVSIFGVEGSFKSGSDVTLGQVNAEGKFQPLAFNGTEAADSGIPETVEAYYGFNGVLPVPDSGGATGCEYYKCASVDTGNKTWTGYKAVTTDGIYSFEENATEGLTYGTAYTPKVDSIYNAAATIQVSELWGSVIIPTDGLVFYAPFSSNMVDEVTVEGPYKVSGGVSIQSGAAMFPAASVNYMKYSPITDTIPSSFALSLWIKYDIYTNNNTPVLFGNSLNESQTSWIRFSSETKFKIGAQSTGGVQLTLTTPAPQGQFNHVLVNFSGSKYEIYINGTLSAVYNSSTPFALNRDIWFGSYYGYDADHSFNGAIKEVRIYDRVLVADEIRGLASEFTLTA